MTEIPLTQGMVALVDDADAGYLNIFKWYAKERNKSWYAVRMQPINNRAIRGSSVKGSKKRRRVTIRMHNVIMNPPDGMMPHHKNGNGLDNQRHNLELLSLVENNRQAQKKRKENQEKKDVPF